MTMRRVCKAVWAGAVIFSLLASGCGRDPFGAPARSRSSLPSLTDEPKGARAIFMILPAPPTGELEVWGILAQREASAQQVVFRVMGAPPSDPSAPESEIIRKAVADGVSALIVVPGDSADLAQSIVEAEAKKVPVVLLGGSIAAPGGAKPFTYVEHAPFEPQAKRIVATTLEDAKKAGRPQEGSVLLVTDKATDRTSAARLAALKSALEAHGLRSVVEVTFDGTTPGASKAAVLEAVKAHPDVIMALSDESEGVYGASQARIALGGQPAFCVGGFAGFRQAVGTTVFEKESCYVDGKVDEMAKLAVNTAIKRLNGEPIEGRVELPSTFVRGSGEVAPPDMKAAEVTAESINKGFESLITKPMNAPKSPGSPPQ